jgi:hypothetical protein
MSSGIGFHGCGSIASGPRCTRRRRNTP